MVQRRDPSFRRGWLHRLEVVVGFGFRVDDLLGAEMDEHPGRLSALTTENRVFLTRPDNLICSLHATQ